MNQPYAVALSKKQLKPFAPGISWSVLPGDGMTLVYWVFEPPACGEVPLHHHEIAQAGVVLEGAITMRYANGEERTLHPGDMYVVGSNVPHSASFPERCVVVDVFTPNREEYEQRYAQGATTPAFASSN
ncbi:MAG: cupin domain-containing protein [Candidatus Eremiobacteraeota bacterium]|nr:cupin domain-containing protein [Candidatus Eremiobacteraeota bacterium]